MLYHPASHLSTFGERASENEENESEEGDETEFEPPAKRPRSGCHASSFIL